jgi:hypothetical protein
MAAPAYALTSSQYIARAIAISVYPIMEAGQLKLCAADDEAEAAIERFKDAIEGLAPAHVQDCKAWASTKVVEMFKHVPHDFDGDVWYRDLPGGVPLLVVKKASVEQRQMTLEQAIRSVHVAQIGDALQAGMSVPDAVLQEYKLSVDSASTREIQF